MGAKRKAGIDAKTVGEVRVLRLMPIREFCGSRIRENARFLKTGTDI